MPSCIVISCKNNSCFEKKRCGITFHKFPTEPKWREKWVDAIRKNRCEENWVPSRYSVVCSVHFDDNSIESTKAGLRRVKKNALPVKLQLINSAWCQDIEAVFTSEDSEPESPEQCVVKKEPDSDNQIDEQKQENEVNEEPAYVVPTFDGFYQYNDSEWLANLEHGHTSDEDDIANPESEVDSDVEIDCSIKGSPKRQIKMYQIRCKVQAKKIRNLNQNLRRMKRRNARLKTIVNDYKKTILQMHDHLKKIQDSEACTNTDTTIGIICEPADGIS